jgi:2-keto-4-pentenoate hydratase
MQLKFEELAQSLVKAWTAGETIALSALVEAPRSRADGYFVQDRFAEIVVDQCVGWKVSAAVQAVQVMEGHDGPVVGRLFASRHFTSPAQVPAVLLKGCKIECEFAFRFKREVPVRTRPYTREELVQELVLHPGLEIAGHRYATTLGGRKPTT